MKLTVLFNLFYGEIMARLNITKIVEQGDSYERAFFKWLNDEKINWCVARPDLNYVTIFDSKDIEHIKKYWYELKN